MTEKESNMRREKKKKSFPDHCQEYEEGQSTGRVGEIFGCWTEMAGSLTGGKILDLLKNFCLLPSSLNVFRNSGCFI
jgi:hypothetical protein